MDKKWEHVVVLGAAGKMGRGIALLLLQEIARIKGSKLTLLDTNSLCFDALKKYLREHLLKYAERNINSLRLDYQEREELVDNGDIIHTFVEEALEKVSYVTAIEECRGARMIFEAILEDVEVKAKVFSEVDVVAESEAYYFSNTSSIPIHVLQEKSHIEGRLIGFHFYNPPAVQKLLEIIIPAGVEDKVKEIALGVGKRLNKTIVFSKDIAGFIGNGHFIREIVEACDKVVKLREKMSLLEALCVVNKVTQDFLLRPMGLFQLIDYVGIDVARHIAKIMTEYLPGQVFNTSLIDSMVLAGVKGGQNGDGSQKDGFFSYDKGRPLKVYDLESQKYVPYHVWEEFNMLPQGYEAWKALSVDKGRKEKIAKYFINLMSDESLGAKLALQFLEKSRSIGHRLVKEGVARSIEDVDIVLQNGFFHLYGVDDPWKEVGDKR